MNAPNFLQSEFWGRFKTAFGWDARYITLSDENAPMLVLHKKLVACFSIAYVPWGPPETYLSNNDRGRGLEDLGEKIRSGLPRFAVFIRFDLPWTEVSTKTGFKAPLYKATDVQAPDTVLVNLSQSEDEILAGMKPKTRYNIRLALRKVEVTRPDIAGLEKFYKIFLETASRDGIALHSIRYYRALFEEASRSEDAELHLYIATHENDAIAGIITLFYGEEATYLYGASSNDKRNLMAPYALQWRAMLDAKARGCRIYDLFGIPPDDNPTHPMAGLYRFKTGFGGTIIHRPGAWDYPLRPVIYKIFRLAEKARKTLRDRKKHAAQHRN